jgi:hypothetical protein
MEEGRLGRQIVILEKDVGAHELLQMVYRGEITVTPQQLSAAKEAIAYERPKLTATAHLEGSFYQALEQAIERRANRPPPSKLLEGRATEVHPASELQGNFARMRRRV